MNTPTCPDCHNPVRGKRDHTCPNCRRSIAWRAYNFDHDRTPWTGPNSKPFPPIVNEPHS